MTDILNRKVIVNTEEWNCKMEYRKKSLRDNLKFIVPILIIVSGYLFFFSSKWWMPVGSDVSFYTKLGEAQDWKEREITVIRWDYCEKDRSMEIELDIKNNSFDGINKYVASATDINEGFIDIAKVVEEPDWIIIKLSDVPKRWTEISLRLGMSEDDDEPCKVYTNILKVNHVDKLGQDDITGYRLQRFNLEIANYEREIAKNQKEIEKKKKTNEEINQEIKRLEENKKFETDQQKTETDEIISNARTEININNTAVQELEQKIAELQKRIEKIKEQTEELKNGG